MSKIKVRESIAIYVSFDRRIYTLNSLTLMLEATLAKTLHQPNAAQAHHFLLAIKKSPILVYPSVTQNDMRIASSGKLHGKDSVLKYRVVDGNWRLVQDLDLACDTSSGPTRDVAFSFSLLFLCKGLKIQATIDACQSRGSRCFARMDQRRFGMRGMRIVHQVTMGSRCDMWAILEFGGIVFEISRALRRRSTQPGQRHAGSIARCNARMFRRTF